MAGGAEVGGAKAEEHGHGAAESAFELKIIRPVLRARLLGRT